MEQAELDSELRMRRDGCKGLLGAVSNLEKVVSNLVGKFLNDQVGVGLELGPLVSIELDIWEEPADISKESHGSLSNTCHLILDG